MPNDYINVLNCPLAVYTKFWNSLLLFLEKYNKERKREENKKE
jgi:hypothetical protein